MTDKSILLFLFAGLCILTACEEQAQRPPAPRIVKPKLDVVVSIKEKNYEAIKKAAKDKTFAVNRRISLPPKKEGGPKTSTRPLIYAMSLGHKEMAILLLELGADVNLPDDSGKPPLDLFANGPSWITTLLKTHGAMTQKEINRQSTLARLKPDARRRVNAFIKYAEYDYKKKHYFEAAIHACRVIDFKNWGNPNPVPLVKADHLGLEKYLNTKNLRLEVWRSPQLRHQHSSLSPFEISPKGDVLATADDNIFFCSVAAWNLQTGAFLGRHKESVKSVAFSQQGDLLAHAYIDLFKIDLKSFQVTKSRAFGEQMNAASFGSLQIGHTNRQMKLIDADKERFAEKRFPQNIQAVAISPDASLIAVHLPGNIIQIHPIDQSKGVLPPIHTFKTDMNIGTMRLSADNQWLAVASRYSGGLLLYDLNQGEHKTLLNKDTRTGISDLIFTLDSQELIASNARKQRFSIWSTKTGKLTKTWPINFEPGYMRLSKDEKTLYFTRVLGFNIRRFNLITGKEIPPATPLAKRGALGHISDARFTPDGKYIISVGEKISTWDTKRGQIIAQQLLPFSIWQERASSVKFSSNGRWLITIYKAQADVWDISNPEKIKLIKSFKRGQGSDHFQNALRFESGTDRLIYTDRRFHHLYDLNNNKLHKSYHIFGENPIDILKVVPVDPGLSRHSPDGLYTLKIHNDGLSLWARGPVKSKTFNLYQYIKLGLYKYILDGIKRKPLLTNNLYEFSPAFDIRDKIELVGEKK